MKKIIVFLLCASLFTGVAFADEISLEDVKAILTSMEIVDGGVSESSYITRKELAKILIKSSEYASMAEAEMRMSPFADVPYNYENASYIRLAAVNGYMTAYIDGEFKPDNFVKKEEAITAVLKLLGYKNEDFTQSYPYEQIMIAKNIGITEDINVVVGENISIGETERLIYNALTTVPKNGSKKYVEILGYSTTGENIMLNDVMTKNVSGPITYKETELASIGLLNPTLYINGKLSNENDLAIYDILYYNKNSNTIWAYREKITGTLEAVLPNKEAPTSVTISGISYKLSSYSAQRAFAVGGYSLGNVVTLLLDRNKEASDAYLTESLYSEQVGVITSAGKKDIVQTDGNTKISYYATVLFPAGYKTDVVTSSDYSKKIGYAAKISYKNGKMSIYRTSKTTEISGNFSLDKNMIGTSYKVSPEVNILEIDNYGNTKIIYPERLDGVYLDDTDVKMVTKDMNGIIDSMIIGNVTGDTANYGIMTDIIEKNDNSSYTVILDGNEKTYSNSEKDFSAEIGPVKIVLSGQTVEEISELKKVSGSIVDVNNIRIESSKGETLKVSSDVTVYEKTGGSYNLSTIEEAMSGEYNVSAYYDKGEKDGGRVRVIIIS